MQTVELGARKYTETVLAEGPNNGNDVVKVCLEVPQEGGESKLSISWWYTDSAGVLRPGKARWLTAKGARIVAQGLAKAEQLGVI